MGRETVSADSSVLIILAKSGNLGILPRVFDAIRVETAVERECLVGIPQRTDARAIEAAFSAGLLTRATADPSDLRTIAKRHPALGPGEIGAIALARKGIVLVDDGLARRVVRLEGGTPVGTLGLVARAHRLGALGSREELAAMLRSILAAGLWVDASVMEAFWAHIDDEG
ncbi:MAG TPA: hypothetical protein VM370_10025 [Candidatus Thermoplasmatota archaeon]|nr:hypothetical protein [Candidatus Thermoplasmatota archaeon]